MSERGRTCPVCLLPERVHLFDGTCPGSIFEPVPTRGLPPRPRPSKRPPRGLPHSVVMHDGQLAHDPHPTRAGLIRVDWWLVVAPLDPARHQPDSPRIATRPWRRLAPTILDMTES